MIKFSMTIKPFTLKELHLPESFADLTLFDNGMIVVHGRTGSGKTSTMATLTEIIAQRNDYNQIISFEDPLEYDLSQSGRVRQVQVIDGWAKTIRANTGGIQPSPFVFIGELRDPETTKLAMELAKTRLVIAGMHSNRAEGTVERILDMYPANEQEKAREQLANVFRASVGQLLVRNGNRQSLPLLEVFFSGLLPNKRIQKGDIPGIREDVNNGVDGSFSFPVIDERPLPR